MRRRYKLLQLKFDRLSLRERIIVLVAACGVILFFWQLIFYSSQINWFEKTNTKIELERKQTRTFTEKRNDILKMLKVPDTHHQMNRHGELLKQLQSLDIEVGKYKHEYVSPKELSSMMHAMLNNIKGVKLIQFESLIESGESKEETSSSVKQENEVGKSRLIRNRYRLAVEGNFFATLEYLKRLEAIEWRLYWDKFSYQVVSYPRARVLIDFYTLTNRDELLNL